MDARARQPRRSKPARRLQAAPQAARAVHAARGRGRREHRAFARDAAERRRAIAARGRAARGPIVVGPWLAEVGYEVLYWIPFLRWFWDAHGVPRERLIVVSRGGMEAVYATWRGATSTSST